MKRKLDKLTLKTNFGKIYFIVSIIETIFCIVLGSLIAITNNYALAITFWVFALAYCIFILVCEIVRSKVCRKKEEPNEVETVEENPSAEDKK